MVPIKKANGKQQGKEKDGKEGKPNRGENPEGAHGQRGSPARQGDSAQAGTSWDCINHKPREQEVQTISKGRGVGRPKKTEQVNQLRRKDIGANGIGHCGR